MNIKLLNECYEFENISDYCAMSMKNKFLIYEFIIHKNIFYENISGNISEDLIYEINIEEIEKKPENIPYSQQNLKKDKVLIEFYSQNSEKNLKGSLIHQNVIEPNILYKIQNINTESLANPDYNNSNFDFLTVLVYFKYLL